MKPLLWEACLYLGLGVGLLLAGVPLSAHGCFTIVCAMGAGDAVRRARRLERERLLEEFD